MALKRKSLGVSLIRLNVFCLQCCREERGGTLMHVSMPDYLTFRAKCPICRIEIAISPGLEVQFEPINT